jgi:PAS domain S-box-containing protein
MNGSGKIMTAEIRATGLEAIPEIPWGTHLCQFYKTADDLLRVTLPFIKAGLENNEYCLWVAWEPVDTAQIMEALANDLPDPAVLFDSRQIEVASHCTPEFQRGPFQAGGFADPVRERIEKAIAMGCEGARIAHNLSWHHESDWGSLIEGERTAAEALAQYPVIALCSYPIDGCTGFQMKDVGSAHHYVLVSVGGQCEVIDGGQRREETKRTQPDTGTSYQEVFENMLDGMVLVDTETMEGLLANNAAALILGFDSPDAMVGLNPFRSFTRHSGQRVTPTALKGLLRSEHHLGREITGVSSTGREIWLSSVGVRTEYQGRQAELIAVRDITGSRKPPRGPHTHRRRESPPEKVRA